MLHEFIKTAVSDKSQKPFCNLTLGTAHLAELGLNELFAQITGTRRGVVEQILIERGAGVGPALAAHAAVAHHFHEFLTGPAHAAAGGAERGKVMGGLDEIAHDLVKMALGNGTC